MNLRQESPGFHLGPLRTRHEYIHVGSDAAIHAAYGPDRTQVEPWRFLLCRCLERHIF